MPLIYSPPLRPSLLLNDFLLPLAFFPLSSSTLHKSTRSLDPSKANDHHLFSSSPVSFFQFPPMAHFLLPSHTHAFWCTCTACISAHIYRIHIVYTVHIYIHIHTVYSYSFAYPTLPHVGPTDDQQLDNFTIQQLTNYSFTVYCGWYSNSILRFARHIHTHTHAHTLLCSLSLSQGDAPSSWHSCQP